MNGLGNHFYRTGINCRATGWDFQSWFGNPPHPLTAANDDFKRCAGSLIASGKLNRYPCADFSPMGDIRIVTGIFYYRADGMIFLIQSATMDRDINVVTGQPLRYRW
jgi:hypothetical protein